ncbi:MAG TPA: regulatory iron-sulfur-containing complex subunit RicT [Anaerolineales bacterium]
MDLPTAERATPGAVAIRFQPLGKLYHFESGGFADLRPGDYVLVSTSRGREMGEVVTLVSRSKAGGGLKSIERKATAQELVVRRMWQRKELEAMIDCRAKATEFGLEGVKIAKAEFSYDGSRLTYLYNYEPEDKLDLKPLKDALQEAHPNSRIDFRQIGPRDVAKIIGGMGACGLETRCCSMFLTEFSPISIKMAKAQGISLSPQEITGMCGRLRCCLVYEYEEYVKARKELPRVKKRVMTPLGEGRVVEVLPLKMAVIVLLEREERRVEFLKHEVEPYDELKALENKANGPCDRHLGGGCTCGKG